MTVLSLEIFLLGPDVLGFEMIRVVEKFTGNDTSPVDLVNDCCLGTVETTALRCCRLKIGKYFVKQVFLRSAAP